MEQEKMMHIQCRKGDIGKYVILPGDPGRVEKIAAYLTAPVKVAENREFVTYTGELEGVRVSVCSTGIGGPSAAIAMEELVKCGADTFIRVGWNGTSLYASGISGSSRYKGAFRAYSQCREAEYEISCRNSSK